MPATKLDIREVYPLKHGRPSRLQQAVRALIEVALEQDNPAAFVVDAIDEIATVSERLGN